MRRGEGERRGEKRMEEDDKAVESTAMVMVGWSKERGGKDNGHIFGDY